MTPAAEGEALPSQAKSARSIKRRLSPLRYPGAQEPACPIPARSAVRPPSPFQPWPRPAAVAVCANCQAPLQGPFCHACGQPAKVRDSVLDLARDLWARLIDVNRGSLVGLAGWWSRRAG
ncbi:hypothetical protein CSW58_07365 [Caulobacter sp. B11]|uniref:hypothetical protein n=1 Tax=Caulobacter sp. B11 TaxID=2048899 RepID=UPI000C12DF34|nr:hypothetical protein [Caulobacter sp. B11]PHY13193.1 hypothetical protein CSW58_07365 [Caulobacter sp. B11]